MRPFSLEPGRDLRVKKIQGGRIDAYLAGFPCADSNARRTLSARAVAARLPTKTITCLNPPPVPIPA